MTIHSKTNGHARKLYAAWEMSPEIMAREFEYVVTGDEDGDSYRFFQYRGSWYDANDGFISSWGLENMPENVNGWQAESAFSAVGIRYADDDYDAVVVTYCHW